MSLTRTTREAAAGYALGLAGQSRDRLPVPWTASPVMDDCAAFCSHVLWGGKPGPILWVDNFKTAGDGTYAAGDDDLAPWDVLLFDWEHNGVGNHVEFMVADLGNGYVQTFGANGSDSREARYRSRPKSYILGRFRPDWAPDEVRPHFPTTSIEHDTANHDEQDDDMTPEQDRRLKNIETMLGGVQNAIGDPKRGLATRLVAVLVIAQKLAKIAKVK